MTSYQLGIATLGGIFLLVYGGIAWWGRMPMKGEPGRRNYVTEPEYWGPYFCILGALVTVVFGIGWVVAELSA